MLVIPALGRWGRKDQKCKTILGSVVSLRLAWDIKDPVSKKNKINLKLNHKNPNKKITT